MKICWVSRWFEALHVSCSSPWMICEMPPFQKYTFVDHGARFLSTYFNTHSNKFVVASFHAINGCVTTWRSRCPSETSRIPFHSCSIYIVFSRYRPQLAFVRYPWPQLGFSLRVSIKFPYAFGGTTQPSGPVCAGGCVTAMPAFTESSLDGHSNAGGWDFFWWNLMAKVSSPSFLNLFHGGKHQNSLRSHHHHLSSSAQSVGCLYKVKIQVKIWHLGLNRQNGIMFECLELMKILRLICAMLNCLVVWNIFCFS